MGVFGIMAVRIQPQPAPETGFFCELFLRCALDVLNQFAVGLVQPLANFFEGRPRLCATICALKASMPPYRVEYRGVALPSRRYGRYFSVSSSQIFTWARTSFTDHSPRAPEANICSSDNPAYELIQRNPGLLKLVQNLQFLQLSAPLTLFFIKLQRLLDIVAQRVPVVIGEILNLYMLGHLPDALEQAMGVLELGTVKKANVMSFLVGLMTAMIFFTLYAGIP